ncbi:hypothetical protein [Photobacterium piscicola]|uniref:Uncharacterized protein n=1 Tax=Photobacterium piscicola TaxID=1378299 RepID=A0ABU6LD68_9GAMM|nr:hypothetical protein [Photobacterium piscicola]
MIIEKTLNFATDFAISPIKGPQVSPQMCYKTASNAVFKKKKSGILEPIAYMGI